MLAVALSLSLGASPPVQQTLASAPPNAFKAPDWTIGYYAWLWAPEATRTRGAEDSTLGVQFTVCPPVLPTHLPVCSEGPLLRWQGDWNVTQALLSLGVKDDVCDAAQKTYCDSMIDFNVNGGQPQDDARKSVMRSYDACRACLMTAADKKEFPPPFSLKSGKYRGAQYISLGGGANAPPWTTEMAKIGDAEIEKVKEAGFTGICFDIEAIAEGALQRVIEAAHLAI